MNDKFDELTKNMAQSVTRRGALKRFSVGLAGIALASIGLSNRAQAGNGAGPPPKGGCKGCRAPYGCNLADTACINNCAGWCEQKHGGF